MNHIAIDPSVNNIGVASYYQEGGKGMVSTHVLNPPKEPKDCIHYLRVMLGRLGKTDELIVEYPTFFASTKGRVAAQQGYTIDLGFIVGLCCAIIPAKRIRLPTPMQWKGNTPKEIVGKRYTEWTGVNYKTITDHEYEAAMMIYWSIKNPV